MTFCLLVWALLLPAAAFAASRPRGGAWHGFALGIYALGSAICHQRPERSFHLFGAQLPVCARCTGIYVGAAVTAVTALFVGSGFSRIVAVPRKLRLEAKPTDVFGPRVLLIVAAIPAALTLVYEWTTGVVPSNAIRAATGIVLGGAIAAILLDALRRPVLDTREHHGASASASGGGAPRE